jgi:hypothetical protein
MKYFLVTALVLHSFLALTQDCTREGLASKPGTWKPGQPGAVNNVTPADLAKEKQTLANIHGIVSAQYKPMGCQVSYSNVFGKYSGEGQSWIADPYHYQLYILRYLCDDSSADKSKYYVDHATPTTVLIAANVVFFLNSLYAANIPTDDSRGYLKMKVKPQMRDGYYFMGEEIVGDYGTASEIREYRWLITYGDTLPFYFVSRKEYLLIQQKRLEQAVLEVPSEREFINQYLHNISEYLKKPEAELGKPAVCMWNDEARFEKFVEEGTAGSFFAVKPNLAYYRKRLPKSTPQFFSVVYKISKGDPVFADNMDAIKNAVDFERLKGMLGK